jgi:hypothetical protein
VRIQVVESRHRQKEGAVLSVSFYSSLNRRHKVVIFVALIGAGVTLVVGASLGSGLGVFLIGIAFAWVVGSDYRPVHVALLLGGVVLIVAPILLDWNQHRSKIASYRESVTLFQSNIPRFAQLHHKNSIDDLVDSGFLRSPRQFSDLDKGCIPRGLTGDQRQAFERKPNWVKQAEDAGVVWCDVTRDEIPSLPEPSAFGLRVSFSSNWRLLFPGFWLACLGLALLATIKPLSTL